MQQELLYINANISLFRNNSTTLQSYYYCLYMYIMHIGKAKFGAALLYAVA